MKRRNAHAPHLFMKVVWCMQQICQMPHRRLASSLLPAAFGGATVVELGQATVRGLSEAFLSAKPPMVAVLHAPDRFDASTGTYAVSLAVGLLPPSDVPLQLPQESYAITSALAGLDANSRKKLALDTTEAAAQALCCTVATQRAQPLPARTP